MTNRRKYLIILSLGLLLLIISNNKIMFYFTSFFIVFFCLFYVLSKKGFLSTNEVKKVVKNQTKKIFEINTYIPNISFKKIKEKFIKKAKDKNDK